MPVNTYQDKPLAGDVLSVSQGDIEHNFLYLANTLGSAQPNKAGGTGPGDHQISIGGLDNVQFEGRHLSVSFKDQGGALAYPQDGTDAYMWSNGGNIFWGNATSGPFQLTTGNTGANFGGDATISPGGPFTTIIHAGWTSLPGGLILQYGQIASFIVNQLIQFPIPFPSGPPFTLQCTPVGFLSASNTVNPITATITASQFQANCVGTSGTSWSFIAIGK